MTHNQLSRKKGPGCPRQWNYCSDIFGKRSMVPSWHAGCPRFRDKLSGFPLREAVVRMVAWIACGVSPVRCQVCTFVGCPRCWAVACLVLSWHAGCSQLDAKRALGCCFPLWWAVARLKLGAGLAGCPRVGPSGTIMSVQGGSPAAAMRSAGARLLGDWWRSPPPFSSILDLAGGPRGERAVLDQRIKGVQ